MKNIVGRDLAGWRIEEWFEIGHSFINAKYFSSKESARSATHNTMNEYNQTIKLVFVLTKNGKKGYMLLDREIQLEV